MNLVSFKVQVVDKVLDVSDERTVFLHPVLLVLLAETIDIDLAIVSVGVSPNPIVPSSIKGLELGRKGTIAVNDNMQSSIPTIFAGGDCPSSDVAMTVEIDDAVRFTTLLPMRMADSVLS